MPSFCFRAISLVFVVTETVFYKEGRMRICTLKRFNSDIPLIIDYLKGACISMNMSVKGNKCPECKKII